MKAVGIIGALLFSRLFAHAANIQVNVPGLVEIAHPANTGSTVIWIVNTAKDPVTPAIEAGPFRSSLTKRMAPGNILFSETPGQQGSSVYVSTKALAVGERRRIIVQISGFADAPEAVAEITTDGEKIAEITAAKHDVPFGVRIEGEPAAHPQVEIDRNKQLRLILKNDDPMTYGVMLRFRVAGQEIQKFAILPAGGSVLIHEPTDALFTRTRDPLQWIGQHLRPEADEQLVRLRYAPTASQTEDASLPGKLIPVQFQLNYLSGEWLSLWSTFIIFLVLLLGGLTSLLLNLGLPKSAAKARLNERLNLAGRDIGDLSFLLDSRARVGAGVSRKRLKDLLASQSVISPEFEDLVKQVGDSVSTLEQRVGLLKQLDAASALREALITRRCPPSLIDSADQQLDICTKGLAGQPSPEELQILTTQVAAMTAFLFKITQQGPGQTDPDFARLLGDRLKGIQAQFPKPFSEHLALYERDLPGIFERLTAPLPDPAALSPDDYYALDLAIQKLLLIKRAEVAYEDASEAAIRHKQDAVRPEFVKYLSTSSWDGLQSARLIVREMEELIDREEIRQAFENKQYSIEANRAMIRRNDQVEFCVCFRNRTLNHAAAREEYHCLWTFHPVPRPTPEPAEWYAFWKWHWYRFWQRPPYPEADLGESGWTIDHYFANARKYEVRVRFLDWFGKPVEDANKAALEPYRKVFDVFPSTSHRFGTRTKVETVRLFCALLVALVALVAGARDQLLKLDILPGLVAVFLLGFGADSIKNLLTQKQ